MRLYVNSTCSELTVLNLSFCLQGKLRIVGSTRFIEYKSEIKVRIYVYKTKNYHYLLDGIFSFTE